MNIIYGGRRIRGILIGFVFCMIFLLQKQNVYAEGPRIAVAATSGGNYAESLQKAGATVVRISSEDDISDFDGLLIPGGADIDPSL